MRNTQPVWPVRIGARELSLLVIVILTVTLGGLFPAPVQAAGGLNMKAEAGFDGYARVGQTLPLRVRVENTGPQVKGTLEVAARQNGFRVLYTREAVLPRGSKKLFTMYIPHDDGTGYQVRLVADGKQLAVEKVRRPVLLEAREVVIGVLASEPSTLNHVAAIKLPGGRNRVTVIHLQPEHIPEKSLAMDHLDVLVMNDFPSSSLSQTQLAAVQSWVERGGMLVLAGGPNWQKTLSPLPGALLPVKVTGSKTVHGLPTLERQVGQKLAAGEGYVISEGRLHRGTALVAEGDTPVVVQAPLGKGNLVYLAFDLALVPFASWAGNEPLWLDLLTRADPHHMITAPDAMMEEIGRRGNLGWVLRNIPGSDLPSTRLLGGMLLLYILVLGPGIYLVLKRFDRREWGWVAVPAVAVVFFAMSYLAGFKGKDRDVFTNIISVVWLEPGSEYAQVNSGVGVFAPTRRSYHLDLVEEKLVTLLETGMEHTMQGPGGGNDQGPVIATVRQGQNTRVDFADSTRWTMRCIRTEDIIPKPGDIEARLQSIDGKISGTVVNRTGTTLTDCAVISLYGYQRLGELAPGAAARVDILPRVSFQSMGMNYVQVFQQYPIHYPRRVGDPFGMGNYPPEKRRQVMEAIAGPGSSPVDEPVVFVGWSDKGLRGILGARHPGRTYYTTAFISPLAVNLNAGDKVSIPPGIINGRLIATEARDIQREVQGYHLNGGPAVFQLDLPFMPDNLQVDEFVLLAPTADYRMAARTGMALYNWTTGQWEEIRYQPLGNLISNWRLYVSEKGSMRVKVGPKGRDDYAFLRGVTVSLKGQHLPGKPQRQGPGPSNAVEGGL